MQKLSGKDIVDKINTSMKHGTKLVIIPKTTFFDHCDTLFILNVESPKIELYINKKISYPDYVFTLFKLIPINLINEWKNKKYLIGFGHGANIAKLLSFDNTSATVIMLGGLPIGNSYFKSLFKNSYVQYHFVLQDDIWHIHLKDEEGIIVLATKCLPPYTLGSYCITLQDFTI